MCNFFTIVQISWGILERSQGPSSAREFWWLLLGMFIAFSVNSPVKESWIRLLWTCENLFPQLPPVDRTACEEPRWLRKNLWKGPGDRWAGLTRLIRDCSGLCWCSHMCPVELWQVLIPSPAPSEVAGEPLRWYLCPREVTQRWFSCPRRGASPPEFPPRQLRSFSNFLSCRMLVERWNGTLCTGNTF